MDRKVVELEVYEIDNREYREATELEIIQDNRIMELKKYSRLSNYFIILLLLLLTFSFALNIININTSKQATNNVYQLNKQLDNMTERNRVQESYIKHLRDRIDNE